MPIWYFRVISAIWRHKINPTETLAAILDTSCDVIHQYWFLSSIFPLLWQIVNDSNLSEFDDILLDWFHSGKLGNVLLKYEIMYGLMCQNVQICVGLTLTLPDPSAGVSGSLDSYCSLKPLCSGMGEVVPARTSPTLLPPSPRTVLSLSCFKVSQCTNCRDWHCKS